MVLKVRDDESLSLASDVLHDAFFAPDDIVYREAERVFRLAMWREIGEAARRRRVIPFVYRIETPRIRCELEVRLVSKVAVQVTDGIGLGQYCLEEVRYDRTAGILEFDIMGPLKLELTIEALCAELRDQGEITWEGPNISTFTLSRKP